jgi:hypothetical protein
MEKAKYNYNIGDKVFIKGEEVLGGFEIKARFKEEIPKTVIGIGGYDTLRVKLAPAHEEVQYKVKDKIYSQDRLKIYSEEQHRLYKIEYRLDCLEKPKSFFKRLLNE